MMKVIVIGAGFTGLQLAKSLIAEDRDVVLIEKDPLKVRHARNSLDCTIIEGDGNNPDTLFEAGLSSADALVTLTDDDEINMITCSLVDDDHPDILKIARVRNYAYYVNTSIARRKRDEKNQNQSIRPLFGIDVMLNPEVETSKAISSAVAHGAIGNIIKLGDNHVITSLLVEEDSDIANKPIKKLAEIPEWKFIVAYVETKEGATLPVGETVLKPGDHIGVLLNINDLPNLAKISGAKNVSAINSIAVFGADRVGMLVAERLLAEGKNSAFAQVAKEQRPAKLELSIVDRDASRCKEATEHFENATVLCGDITDSDLISEESLDKSDLMVAASGNFDSNLVIAAYFKSRGVKRTIALTLSSEFNDVANKLGIDVAIPMRDTVVDAVLSHLRGKNVKSIHSVCNRTFEIIECGIDEGSKAAGKTLSKMAAKGQFLALLVRRENEENFSIPNGETLLQAGGRIVMIIKGGDNRTIRLFCR